MTYCSPACLLALLLGFVTTLDAADRRPNVVLVMSDDHGYGDLACHGNEQIKTPNLDRLYTESVRLTDYHVDPTCSPTRSALMTGRYSSRTGVWHTIMGRSLMAADEVTIAELFRDAGYRTGIFGKWHLGDNYPLRPQDQGFDEVLVHGGGGVGQTPDYWGNDYFGDTYWHNGKPKQFDGYCTDVWFDGAIRFIESSKDRPFFCYIPTNAAHGPFLVAEKYSRPYKEMGVPSPRAEFYGMITSIDENIARLRKKLAELGIARDTILIFTTDNGTAAGTHKGGFNAGMRGQKGSEYDGGHRVPFFLHYPAGDMTGGRDVDRLTAHIDVLPTLAELCGVDLPKSLDIDGRSLVPLLRGTTEAGEWPDRVLAVHSQRVEHPQKWRKAAVMTDRWRFVCDGKRRELFDIQADPGQKNNVASEHPETFQRLSDFYEQWYEHVSERFDDYVRIRLGDEQAKTAHLTCHDWHTDNKQVPWNQTFVRRGMKSNGYWAVDIARGGRYEITARLRPHYADDAPELEAKTAHIAIAGIEQEQAIEPDATQARWQLELPPGPAQLEIQLGKGPRSRGAYFVDVKYLGE